MKKVTSNPEVTTLKTIIFKIEWGKNFQPRDLKATMFSENRTKTLKLLIFVLGRVFIDHPVHHYIAELKFAYKERGC